MIGGLALYVDHNYKRNTLANSVEGTATSLVAQEGQTTMAGPSTSITVSLPSTTISSPDTTATSPYGQGDVRIGVMIPAYILYKGQLFRAADQVVDATNSAPADLSPIGSGIEALDQKGVPKPGSAQYDVYAIEGTSQEKAIAVKFQGTSSSGPVWVWRRYERK